MKLKLYAYEGCGTCKKALRWLDANNLNYQTIPIRSTPPSKAELKQMIEAYDGNVQRLLNVSGQDYRDMKMKERLPEMTTPQLIDLLSQHGNLVKRPFVIGDDFSVVGFDEKTWEAALL